MSIQAKRGFSRCATSKAARFTAILESPQIQMLHGESSIGETTHAGAPGPRPAMIRDGSQPTKGFGSPESGGDRAPRDVTPEGCRGTAAGRGRGTGLTTPVPFEGEMGWGG